MKKLILIIGCFFIMSCVSVPQKLIKIEEHFQAHKRISIKAIAIVPNSNCEFLIKDLEGNLWYIFVNIFGKINNIEKVIFYK